MVLISWASEPHRAVVTACGNNLVAFRMDNGINDIRHIDDWKRRSISDADKPKPCGRFGKR